MLLFLLAPLLAFANPDRLGEIEVGRRAALTSLTPWTCAPQGQAVSHLKLVAQGDPVRLHRLFVIHPSGAREEIHLGRALAPGESTPWIPLRGRSRCLRRIALDARTGRSTPFPARVEVWAWNALRR